MSDDPSLIPHPQPPPRPAPRYERAEPETCTVELSTGSFVLLAHRPSDVLTACEAHAARHDARRGQAIESPLKAFSRVTGGALTKWAECYLNVEQIVAVYPIAGRPEPGMVYNVLTAGGMVPQGS